MANETGTAVMRPESGINPSDLMASIYQVARDPATDVAKMSALISLLNEQQDRSARQAFNSSMVACQAEMPRVTKDKRIIHEARPGKTGMSVRYATYERIDECVRPIYQQHGFSVQFSTATPEAGKYVTTATVRHSGGHSEPYTMPLQLDQSGGKNDIQGMGSTMAYARRYLLTMIFNIVTEGDDQDGQNHEPCISQDQADTIDTLLTDQRRDRSKFFAWAAGQAGHEVTKLTEIPARLYSAVMQALRPKGAR